MGICGGMYFLKLRMLRSRAGPVHHVSAIGRTYRSYDWFYKVRDRYETFIDKETMLPLKYSRDISEGSYKFKYEYDWNRQKKEVKSKYTNAKGEVKNTTVKFSEMCTQDVLSAIFYTRCMDFSKLKPGETIPMPLVLDGKEYSNLYVRYLGKDVLETDFGTFNTIKFAPLLIDGTLFSGGEKMTVWATDDANRIPLKVESPISVGHLKAFLTSASGLKYKMTAKIK